jgi:hypothetical protein
MAKRLKYWHMTLEERNGEQEYSYDYLIRADKAEEAWKIARRLAAGWYGEDEDGNPEGSLVDGEDRVYEFPGTWILVSIDYFGRTKKGEFIEYMLNRYMIGGYDRRAEVQGN